MTPLCYVMVSIPSVVTAPWLATLPLVLIDSVLGIGIRTTLERTLRIIATRA